MSEVHQPARAVLLLRDALDVDTGQRASFLDRECAGDADLRAETPMSRQERAEAKTLGLDYINLPMSDKAPRHKQVKTFIDTTRLAL